MAAAAPGIPDSASGLGFGDKVVILGGAILAGLALSVLNPILPSIEKALAHGPTDAMLVKQLFGATSLAMVFGAPLGGFLVDRIGMRLMLLAASLIYTIAGTSGFYLSSLNMLLVSRLFLGAAAAATQVMSFTLINTKLQGIARARWMGIHISVATGAALVVTPISGALGEISWRWPFLTYGVGLVLFIALLIDKSVSAGPSARPALTAIKEPSVLSWFPWHYVPLSLAVGGITFLPAIYMPYLLREDAGLSTVAIGAVLTANSAIGVFMSSQYGRGRKHLSTSGAYVFSFGFATAGVLLAGTATGLPLLVAGMILHVTGTAWFVPNVMTALSAKVTSAQQARAAGLVKAAHFMSAPLFVVLVDPISRQYGKPMVILMVAAVSFAFFIIMVLRKLTIGKVVPVQVH